MQENWSLILNVLLLVGVILAIGRIMTARKQSLNLEFHEPRATDTANYNDDIIAVRKVNAASFQNPKIDVEESLFKNPSIKPEQPRLVPYKEEQEQDLKIGPKATLKSGTDCLPKAEASSILMVFLLAKETRQFAGYELLQTVLAAGLRFGEGHLFHRHQFSNGQGPVLCSLAAATATGIFDLQNMGAFSVRGLCLYMHTSKNPGIDKERFAVMLDTAKQLSEGLDAYLLDDKRRPLTEEWVVSKIKTLC